MYDIQHSFFSSFVWLIWSTLVTNTTQNFFRAKRVPRVWTTLYVHWTLRWRMTLRRTISDYIFPSRDEFFFLFQVIRGGQSTKPEETQRILGGEIDVNLPLVQFACGHFSSYFGWNVALRIPALLFTVFRHDNIRLKRESWHIFTRDQCIWWLFLLYKFLLSTVASPYYSQPYI